MAGLTFLSDNKIEEAEFEMISGTENVQFPLTNMQIDFTTKVFRSNETEMSILVDLKTTKTIDSFAIVGSSVSGLGFTALVIYGSGTTDFTGATEYSIDLSQEYSLGYKLFDTPMAYRYWKIKATNTTGSYVEISNLYLGAKTEFLYNGIDADSFSFTNMDNALITRNKYGQKFIDKYNTIKHLTGNVKYMNKDEFNAFFEINKEHGTVKPVYMLPDLNNCLADDGEYIFSGLYYFTEDITWVATGKTMFNISLDFTEAT